MSDTKEKKDNLITVYKAAQSLGIKAEVGLYAEISLEMIYLPLLANIHSHREDLINLIYRD